MANDFYIDDLSIYFDKDSVDRSLSSKDIEKLQHIRSSINSFENIYDQFKYIQKRRSSSLNRLEDKRLFNIPEELELISEDKWPHESNIYYKHYDYINAYGDWDDNGDGSDNDSSNGKNSGNNQNRNVKDYRKRDKDCNIIKDKYGNDKYYGKLGRGLINLSYNAKNSKVANTARFIITHWKLLLILFLTTCILIACLNGALFVMGTINSIGHTPFVLCGEDEITGETIVQIPNANVEEAATEDYSMNVFISITKSRNWNQNAIIGTVAYILAEGAGMGTFTYESNTKILGPSGVYKDKTLNNQAWLRWIKSEKTLDTAYEVYYKKTHRYAAMGLGLTQESDVYNSKGSSPEDTGATKMILAAEEAGKPWQDPQWQINYILDNLFVEHSGDSDYIDPMTYDGSAEEYCKRVSTFIGMPGWKWDTTKEKQVEYIKVHTQQLARASLLYATALNVNIESLEQTTTNPCQQAKSVASGGNATIADAAVSLASGVGKENKILFDGCKERGHNCKALQDQRLKTYKEKHIEYLPGDIYFADCGRSVTTAIRWSGADMTFPTGTGTEYTYMQNSPKWTYVGDYGSCDLQPGDVLITKGQGHVKLYVGEEAVQKRFPGQNADMYAGSLDMYFPYLYKDAPGRDGKTYAVFRNTNPDNANGNNNN